MLNYISETLNQYGVTIAADGIMCNLILMLIIIIIGIIANLITKKIILRLFTVYVENNRFKWDNIMLEKKVFSRLCYLVPPLVVYFFIPYFSTQYQDIIEKITLIYITIIISSVLGALLDSVNAIYNSYTISKTKPIKGIIQIFQILVYMFAAIILVSTILGKSPVIILSGIGALTAVLLIVFKDSLLGLVSGIQIATNDLIRIGDWIEMPKYEADGEVTDISLNTIKVQNFDRTVTNIPSYAIVSDSFKNWRSMQESGGRRIKRSLFIESTSIEFCSTRMLEKLKKANLLTNYLTNKQIEIDKYNDMHNLNPNKSMNARRLTNIGTFREYIYQYLRNHPGIHKNMTIMVRQLQPGENGVPLEVYAFTNDTNWVNYEKIQADIFDHLFSIAPEFNIRIFQNPSGFDLRTGLQKNIEI